MRVFLQGNKDVASWHLPVAQAKFNAFVQRCKKAGLKQDRFTMRFDDTGTVVFGQYFYGKESLQLYSPVHAVVPEESKVDLSPKDIVKTFFINTEKGYFWVEVRYDKAGKPFVNLIPFTAKVKAADGITEKFVYPGMGQQAWGMLSDVVGDTRFVLTQKAGVFYGDDKEKGTIKLPASFGEGRVTVVQQDTTSASYVVITGEASNRRVGLISIAQSDEKEFVVEFEHTSISTSQDAEDGTLPATVLHPLPNFIHRKCFGSYFSPQKTIGFHVDIGSDDEFLGNMTMIGGGLQDKLVEEFNHTRELYQFLNTIQFPIVASGSKVQLFMVSPTMLFSSLNPEVDMCWGGAAWSGAEGCADYQRDFPYWILAPHAVLVEIDLISGEKIYTDVSGNLPGTTSNFLEVQANSWCGQFYGRLIADVECVCEMTALHEEPGDEVENCSWTEVAGDHCGYYEEGSYEFTNVLERTIFLNRMDYIREILYNRKFFYFIFGPQEPSKETSSNAGFCHLVDAKWHLDVGILWASDQQAGERCRICSYPQVYQNPGENIWFVTGGDDADKEWIAENGHEYAENLEIVTPLGFHYIGFLGATMLGFEAHVPESFAAPHEPEVLVGGIEYPSQDVESGVPIRCERALMSTPCLCEDTMVWRCDGFVCSELTLEGGHLWIEGGCPPYDWVVSGGRLEYNSVDYGTAERNTQKTSFDIIPTSECAISVSVTDACGQKVVKSATFYTGTGVVSGSSFLEPNEVEYYAHNLTGEISYTGTLTLVELGVGGAYLMAPETGGDYTVSFSTSYCGGNSASMAVVVSEYCPYPKTGNGQPYAGMLVSSPDGTRCGVVTSSYGNAGCIISNCLNYRNNPNAWNTTTGLNSGSLNQTVSGSTLWQLVQDWPNCAGGCWPGDCCFLAWSTEVIWVKS